MDLIRIVLAFFFCQNCSAQLAVSGVVIDEESIPIEFASVFVLQLDSQNIINGTITDSTGSFQINLSRGTYLIVTKFVGFKADSNVVQISESGNLPTIQLKENIQTIKGVEIKGKKNKVVREVDRLIFNYSNAVSVEGGTAIDALQVTPGLIVRNNGISMNGKKSVKVMINGKEQNLTEAQAMELLQTIDAETIKNIEVITTPPSNFDAGENIGVININLKSPMYDHWKAYLKASQSQATYGESSIRGKFTYQKRKLGLSANLSYKYGSWLSHVEQRILYNNQSVSTVDSLIDRSNRLIGGMNLNYMINDRNTLSGSYSTTMSSPKEEMVSNSLLFNPLSGITDSTIQTNVLSNKSTTFHGGTIIFNHVFDTLNRKMKLVVDAFNLSESNRQNFDSRTLESTNGTEVLGQNSGSRNITNYSVKMDVAIPTKKIKIDFGAKYSSIFATNDLEYLISNIELLEPKNTFGYSESTLAAYVQGKGRLTKKMQLKMGLRLESTQSKGTSEIDNEVVQNNYTRLFPTLHLSYDASEKHSLSLEFGSRINRPRFGMMNPFKVYSSPFSYIEGNPFLRPSFSNEVRINHVFRQLVNSSIYYKKVDDQFSLLTSISQGTIEQSSIPMNYLDKQIVGISESIGFDLKKLFSTNLSLDVSYQKSYSNNSSTSSLIEGWNSYVAFGNSLFLNKKKMISLSADLFYQLPSVYGIDRNYEVFNLDVGLRMMFFEKKLVVNLGVIDVFASNKMQWEADISEINFYNSYRSDNPIFHFSLSYSFGQKKVRTQSVYGGNQNEKMRAN